MSSLGMPNGNSIMAGKAMRAPVMPVMAMMPWTSPRACSSRTLAFRPSVATVVAASPRATASSGAALRQVRQFPRRHVGLKRGDDRPRPDADVYETGLVSPLPDAVPDERERFFSFVKHADDHDGHS